MWKGDRQGSSGCPCLPNTPALSQQHGLGWTASCPAEQVSALCGGCFLCACPGLALCGQRCWDGPGDGSALSILNVLPLQGQRVACEVLSQEGQLWHCQENMCQRGGGVMILLGHGFSGHLALFPLPHGLSRSLRVAS